MKITVVLIVLLQLQATSGCFTSSARKSLHHRWGVLCQKGFRFRMDRNSALGRSLTCALFRLIMLWGRETRSVVDPDYYKMNDDVVEVKAELLEVRKKREARGISFDMNVFRCGDKCVPEDAEYQKHKGRPATYASPRKPTRKVTTKAPNISTRTTSTTTTIRTSARATSTTGTTTTSAPTTFSTTSTTTSAPTTSTTTTTTTSAPTTSTTITTTTSPPSTSTTTYYHLGAYNFNYFHHHFQSYYHVHFYYF
ncbi:unnamed protein product [Orchesella dallaii]|uniref:Uncharacterized protein n=1 Tax=Orchesella dallaii TaxID=48710 RepID=A0ABP1RPT3_9HEXA